MIDDKPDERSVIVELRASGVSESICELFALKSRERFRKAARQGFLVSFLKVGGEFVRQRFAVWEETKKAPPAPSKALCAARAT
jgi:hypothetical protein